MIRGGRGKRRDEGAAAVEFALLVPIFVLLSVAMLSGGLMLWHTIATTQASRDAGRLGSTIPIASVPTPSPDGSQGYPIEDWLRRNLYVALEGGGWSPQSEGDVLATDLDASGEAGYACVAYLKPDTGGTLTSKHMAVGTPIGAEPAVSGETESAPVKDGACYSDGSTLTSARVQVLIHRREQFNLILAAPEFDVYGRVNMPYEREVP